jgi:multiple sugar transport system substrate-binding protein
MKCRSVLKGSCTKNHPKKCRGGVMVRKKLLTRMLVLLLIFSMILGMAGCKKDGKTSTDADGTKPATTQEETKKDEGPKDLKVYFNGWTTKMPILIERFNKIRPDVKIDYVDIGSPNDVEKIQKYDTLVASGERIDLSYHYPFDTMLRAINGAALPMDEYIKEFGDDFIADYGEEIDILKYKGKVYGVPYWVNTFKVFYNKDWLSKENVTIPDNWTWDDLIDIARKLADPSKGISGLSYPFTWEDLVFAPAAQGGWKMVVEENGKARPNFDDPMFIKNMEMLYNISVNEKLCPDIARQKSEKLNRRIYFYEKNAPILVDGWFTLVHCNIYRYATEGAKQIDFEIGVTDFPRFDTTTSNEVTYAEQYGNFMIPKTAKNLRDAYQFARFISTENADQIGGVPAYRKTSMDEAIKGIINYSTKEGKEFKDVYPKQLVVDTLTVKKKGHHSFYNLDPLIYAKYYPSVMKVFYQQYDLYLTGQVTIDEFVDLLQERSADEIRKVDEM